MNNDFSDLSDLNELARYVCKVFYKTLEELEKAAELLKENHPILLSTITRQAFEITSKVEFISEHPSHVTTYLLYLRQQEKHKLDRSDLSASKDPEYLEKITNDIKTLKKNVELCDLSFKNKKLWEGENARKYWNKILDEGWGGRTVPGENKIKNKDSGIYNKLSEAGHMDFLFVYERIVNGHDSSSADYEFFREWLDRGKKACGSGLNRAGRKW